MIAVIHNMGVLPPHPNMLFDRVSEEALDPIDFYAIGAGQFKKKVPFERGVGRFDMRLIYTLPCSLQKYISQRENVRYMGSFLLKNPEKDVTDFVVQISTHKTEFIQINDKQLKVLSNNTNKISNEILPENTTCIDYKELTCVFDNWVS